MRLTVIALATLALSACNNTEESETEQVAQANVQAAENTQLQNNKLDAIKPAPQNVESPEAQRIQQAVTQPITANASKESILAGYQTLRQLTEDKSCDNSMQCKVVAVGSRACGGPNDYIVYSSKTADANEVQKLADQITASEAQFNAATGMVSICEHLSRPATQCQQNQCTKVMGSAQSVY
ncbi:hypothetical protein AAEU32_14140 [Pseudoalteromonas sp. SSDWG2]|uniref:hypothetical protein n=1 Tax=Pseudoalteromonas sp. SSDWG2 TaxID=3139391 RepID=UPI003BAB7A6D